MIVLKKIDKINWFACTQLKITNRQKKLFPIPPVFWLAECRYIENRYELAIYNKNNLIGFSVYNLDHDNNEYWISAFLIDKKYQGKFVEYHPWDWKRLSEEEYYKERKEAIDNSEYKGTELIVITDLNEV